MQLSTNTILRSLLTLTGLASALLAQSVPAHGLAHTALGQAQVSQNSQGQLLVDNLGSSGQDGVRISLGGDGWDGYFAPVSIPAGGSL